MLVTDIWAHGTSLNQLVSVGFGRMRLCGLGIYLPNVFPVNHIRVRAIVSKNLYVSVTSPLELHPNYCSCRGLNRLRIVSLRSLRGVYWAYPGFGFAEGREEVRRMAESLHGAPITGPWAIGTADGSEKRHV